MHGVKKLSVALFFSVLVSLTCIYFSNQINAIKVNTQKYIELNTSKIPATYHYLLKLAHELIDAFPAPETISIIRSPIEIGYGDHQTEKMEFLVKLIVNNSKELLSALKNAAPGSDIIVAAGTYQINQSKIKIGHHGTQPNPIRIRALRSNSVKINLNSIEGIFIDKSNWVFENLWFNGQCDSDSTCQHAMHIVGQADNVIIKDNLFTNFNAHIKSNGLINSSTGNREFPDNIQIIHNTFTNEWPRATESPVTPIDIVGGKNWLIANNFIADFEKTLGNKTSYGAFLKGAGSNGVFKNNLVACQWNLKHSSPLDIRIGLSIGGGGTGKNLCDSNNCDIEHYNGKIIENIIVNCSNDVGIYVNKGKETLINRNKLFNTLGIDVRFQQSSATIKNNTIQGLINSRNDAIINSENNHILSIFAKHKGKLND